MFRFIAAAVWPALAVPLVSAANVPLLQAQQPQTACIGRPLSGTVQDSTAAVIPGATIQLDNSPTHTQISAGDGRFNFKCVSPGPHHLTTSAPGFAAAQQDLPARSPADLHITLTPADSISITVDAEDQVAEPCPRRLERLYPQRSPAQHPRRRPRRSPARTPATRRIRRRPTLRHCHLRRRLPGR